MSPSCDCCEACEIDSDGFADLDKWTATSGTWAAVSDRLRNTLGNGNIELDKSTTAPSGVIQIDFRGDTKGQKIDFNLIGPAGSNEGIFIQFELGDSTSRLGECGNFKLVHQKGATTNTIHDFDFKEIQDSTGLHRLIVCYNWDHIYIRFGGSNIPGKFFTVSAEPSASAAFNVARFTITTVQASGSVLEFDDFSWQRLISGSEVCYDCDPCDDNGAFHYIAQGPREQSGYVPTDIYCDETADFTAPNTSYEAEFAVVTAWDREHGYSVRSSINWTSFTTHSLWLDGNGLEARFEKVSVSGPYIGTEDALKLSLYEGASLLATRTIWMQSNSARQNLLNWVQASVKERRFSCGIGTVAASPDEISMVLEADASTAAHGGDTVKVTSDDTISNFGSSYLMQVVRCAYFPGCLPCDDAGETHQDKLTLEMPDADYGVGGDSCGAATITVQYVEHCYWEYFDGDQHLTLRLDSGVGPKKWNAVWHVCDGDDLSTSSGSIIFQSDVLAQPVECDDLDDVELERLDDATDIALLSTLP